MSPAAHDVIEVTDTPEGAVLECACGQVYTAATLGDARARHRAHHGLEMARSALLREERQ